MKLEIAQFLTIMLFALVAGVFWGTWFSLSRSISRITLPTFLEVGKTIIGNLAWPMRFLMPGAILASFLTFFLMPDRGSPASLFTAAGALLMIAARVITLSVNVPIDNRIRTWTESSMPPDWGRIRDRWEAFHAARTFVSIAALASILIGSLRMG